MSLSAVVLAAGKGTRMKSKLPKVLHPVCGRPMVSHVLDVLEDLNCEKKIAVIGFGKELIEDALKDEAVSFAYQTEILGTGHAVMMAEGQIGDDEDVMILAGDVPLLKTETLKQFYDSHKAAERDGTVLTSIIDNPFGYGRIIKDENGHVLKIVEQKDATDSEKLVREINTGIFCFKGNLLKDALSRLTNDNAQGEYYLTDVIGILVGDNRAVGTYVAEDYSEFLGINNKVQLAEAERIMQERIVKNHQMNGVTIVNPANVYIEKSVIIGPDTVVYPGAFLKGKTIIGSESIIGPNTSIEDSTIGDEVEIKDSTIIKSSVDSFTNVGPYAYLRPNSKVGKHVKIGDFVEVKNSNVGDYSKVSHLSYIGDGDVGSGVNIGCGVVFVNYDGKNKNRTVVEDNAFVGCNVNLVAPVTVEENAYVAAGSTITKDVPSEALSVARTKQKNIEGWVSKKGLVKG